MFSWFFWWRAAWRARREGFKDGIEGIPGESDQEAPGLLQGIAEDGQKALYQALGRWTVWAAQLQARRGWADEMVERWKASVVEAKQQRHEAEDRLAEVKARAAKLDAELNPHGFWYVGGWAYPLSLLVLVALDVPLVYLAFLAFGLDVVQTFLMSALVGLLICAGGHFTGTLLRRRRGSEWLHLLAAAVPAVGLVLAVSFLRENGFLVILNDREVLNPGSTFAGLLMINLGSLSVAFLLASHHRLEPMAGALREARWALSRKDAAVVRAQARLDKWRHTANELDGQLEAGGRRTDAAAKSLASTVNRVIGLYVHENVRAREPHQLVDCLKAKNLPRLSPASDDGRTLGDSVESRSPGEMAP